MATKARNWLITIVILAFPFTLFLVSLFFLEPGPSPALPPLPATNGYQDFMAAGKSANAEDKIDYRKMDEQQLQAFIDSNSNALQLVHAGLLKDCGVTVQFSESYLSNHLDDLAGFKTVAHALAAEGRLAELENRPVDAARSYLNVIRFGQQCRRGGVLIDGLLGIGIERVGTTHLESLAPQLDAKTSREEAAVLEAMDTAAQTFGDVIQQENALSHTTFKGWRYELARLAGRKSMNLAFASAKKKFDAQNSKEQQLVVDLAARAYELDKGHRPAVLADLVPDYLKAVPKDPVAGTETVFLPK